MRGAMTASNETTLETIVEDGFARITICGSIRDEEVCDIRRQLDELLEGGQSYISLELSQVDYISSSGIGMLVSILKTCNSKGIALALCGLRSELKELFTLTRLDKIFMLAPNFDSWKSSLED